jgi:hypothetical protein
MRTLDSKLVLTKQGLPPLISLRDMEVKKSEAAPAGP